MASTVALKVWRSWCKREHPQQGNRLTDGRVEPIGFVHEH